MAKDKDIDLDYDDNAITADITADKNDKADKDEIEIEIEDDTPEKDRGAKPIDEDKANPTDEELATYSDSVKKRIAQLNHAKEDQRRVAEKNARERDEAIKVARQYMAEKAELQKRYSQGEEVYISQAKEKADLALLTAQRKYEDAYEAGDAKLMAAAQAEIADAAMAKREASRWQATPIKDEKTLQKEKTDVYSEPYNAPVPNKEAVEWSKRNKWFGDWSENYDPEMTAFAYGVNDKLIAAGVDPALEPARYYAALDKRVREVFPDYEWGDAPRKSKTVVASVNRSTGGKNKIILTKSQVALAERLGLTPKQYAMEALKLENK